MNEKILQELIKSNTGEEGNIDITKVFDGVNKFANDLVAKKVKGQAEQIRSEVQETVLNDFLKGFDFENKDQFNAFVKNGKATTDELKEKATRLENENGELSKKYGDLEGQFTTASGTIKNYELKGVLSKAGVQQTKIEDALTLANAKVNDDTDFETALKSVLESNPTWTTENQGEEPPKKNTFQIPNQSNQGQTRNNNGWEDPSKKSQSIMGRVWAKK